MEQLRSAQLLVQLTDEKTKLEARFMRLSRVAVTFAQQLHEVAAAAAAAGASGSVPAGTLEAMVVDFEAVLDEHIDSAAVDEWNHLRAEVERTSMLLKTHEAESSRLKQQLIATENELTELADFVESLKVAAPATATPLAAAAATHAAHARDAAPANSGTPTSTQSRPKVSVSVTGLGPSDRAGAWSSGANGEVARVSPPPAETSSGRLSPQRASSTHDIDAHETAEYERQKRFSKGPLSPGMNAEYSRDGSMVIRPRSPRSPTVVIQDVSMLEARLNELGHGAAASPPAGAAAKSAAAATAGAAHASPEAAVRSPVVSITQPPEAVPAASSPAPAAPAPVAPVVHTTPAAAAAAPAVAAAAAAAAPAPAPAPAVAVAVAVAAAEASEPAGKDEDAAGALAAAGASSASLGASEAKAASMTITAPHDAKATIICINDTSIVFHMRKDNVVIGRSSQPSDDETFRLALCKRVSHQHCEVRYTAADNTFTLHNLGKNGTRVDENLIKTTAKLHDRSVIGVGSLKLLFRILDPAH